MRVNRRTSGRFQTLQLTRGGNVETLQSIIIIELLKVGNEASMQTGNGPKDEASAYMNRAFYYQN